MKHPIRMTAVAVLVAASALALPTAAHAAAPAGVASITAAAEAGSGSDSLPATGIDSNGLLGVWVGGGALVLAGGIVTVATSVRRNRREHAAIHSS